MYQEKKTRLWLTQPRTYSNCSHWSLDTQSNVDGFILAHGQSAVNRRNILYVKTSILHPFGRHDQFCYKLQFVCKKKKIHTNLEAVTYIAL